MDVLLTQDAKCAARSATRRLRALQLRVSEQLSSCNDPHRAQFGALLEWPSKQDSIG